MDNYLYYHNEQQEQLHQLIRNPNNVYVQDDRDRDKLPQWSHEETKEFLALRSELDNSFKRTKRNKSLWEDISAKLQLKGFSRTPNQCKSKWKNLVTRFKGSESSMEVEANKGFTFNEEIRNILSKGKGVEEQECEDNDNEVEKELRTKKRRMEMKRMKTMRSIEEEMKSVLRELMRQQMELEAKLMKSMESKENERKVKEQQWRTRMEALYRERMEMEKRIMEKEEARRAREEARDDNRHALIIAILNKLEDKRL